MYSAKHPTNSVNAEENTDYYSVDTFTHSNLNMRIHGSKEAGKVPSSL